MGEGNIYLWTGPGWGKTTSALGVALRAIGHRKKVTIIQFMKGRKSVGEYMVRDSLKPYYSIYQFGREGFVNLEDPSKKDRELARKGLMFAKKAAKEKPFLLILDEINLAASIGLVKVKDVLGFLDKIPKGVTVYLTGRNAPAEFIERADYVTDVIPIKHPKINPEKAKMGIDY